MSIVNLEIYSILIICILITDYYLKHKNKLNINSYIYIIMAGCIVILSSINIFLATNINTNLNVYYLAIVAYIILIIPPICIYLYIYL
ncbi:MAG: hypothetical protein Q4G04_03890 [bacterium]|nr:hypothetical protein [bacterium]